MKAWTSSHAECWSSPPLATAMFFTFATQYITCATFGEANRSGRITAASLLLFDASVWLLGGRKTKQSEICCLFGFSPPIRAITSFSDWFLIRIDEDDFYLTERPLWFLPLLCPRRLHQRPLIREHVVPLCFFQQLLAIAEKLSE